MRATLTPVRRISRLKWVAAAFALIVILAVAFFPLISVGRGRSFRVPLARNTMQTLTMALEDYRKDFNDYPPDNFPSNNGSEMIWYYLCQTHKSGGSFYGPYLKVNSNSLVASDRLSTYKFLSPLGSDYHYIRLVDPDGKCRGFLLVDSGRDKQLGGVLDREKGFIETDPGAAADNIYSTIPPSINR